MQQKIAFKKFKDAVSYAVKICDGQNFSIEKKDAPGGSYYILTFDKPEENQT